MRKMASPRRPLNKIQQRSNGQLDGVRLQKLEAEISRIYDACLESGYDGDEIYEISSPVLTLLGILDSATASSDQQGERSRWQAAWLIRSAINCITPRTWIKVLVVLLFFCGMSRVEWSRVVLSSYGRNALIRVLPYWDWTQLYYQDCLVRNPYHVHRKMTKDDCQVCEALHDTLPRIRNVSHSEMAEDYLKSDVPAIVLDALRDWNLEDGTHSLKNISKILLDADRNGEALPCAFASNLRLRGDNYHRTFLWKLRTENMETKRWYAHWENCDKVLAKALRRSHPRPYFLPPMVDTTEPNWVFVSGADFKGRHFKEVPLLSDMLWLAQVHGSIRVQLRPRHPCNVTCVQMEDVLLQGETLIFTDRLWTFHYLPNDGSVNVAIGGGCSFEL